MPRLELPVVLDGEAVVSSWIWPTRAEDRRDGLDADLPRPSGDTRARVRCRSSFTMPKAGMSSPMVSSTRPGHLHVVLPPVDEEEVGRSANFSSPSR